MGKIYCGDLRWLKTFLLSVVLGMGSLTCIGCGSQRESRARPTAPAPTYTGPRFLHGTIGSMARLRGYEPQLVSGYGLIVNLNGTGSSEVPAYLRQWMLNEMRKRGVGSASLGTRKLTPEKVLASRNTSVVVVQGLIPPGGTKGTRFDVLVSCLPQTQTTSLQGGRLWSVDLSLGGSDPSMRFSQKLGVASGPTYINPFDDRTPTQQRLDIQRQAVVLSGGVATSNREVELTLNQHSWQRSRLIADRINERFPKAPSDHLNTAIAIDDTRITINVPGRYTGRSENLLALISHLYLQGSAGFSQQQAQRLADMLVAQPRYQRDVALAWVAMGKTVLLVTRQYYGHATQEVSMAALEAGARLEDETVTPYLDDLAQSPESELRKRVAELLVHLPRSLRGTRTLHRLLDDADVPVRLQAYESLAAMNDPIIRRQAIDAVDPQRFKFVLDLVPSQRPLVYVAQRGMPRLVIFTPRLGFESPFLSTLWENRLMLRSQGPGKRVKVFYQSPGRIEGSTMEIEPTVAQLVYLLGHQPTMGQPARGLDLTFGQVAGAVYRLSQDGAIAGETHLQINPLPAAIARTQQETGTQPRPETGGRVTSNRQNDTAPEEREPDRPMVGDLGIPGF